MRLFCYGYTLACGNGVKNDRQHKLNRMAKKLSDIGNQELANFLEISRGFASNIRTGKNKLPAKYCIRVSLHFNIPLHNLRPEIFPEEAQTTLKKKDKQAA
jgi:hypothetical protein